MFEPREIDIIRAENIKTILHEEKMKQAPFARKIKMSPENLNRIIKLKHPLTEATAETICAYFPKYRIEWLLGYDPHMTDNDIFDSTWKKAEGVQNDNYYIMCKLLKRKGIDFTLYDSGICSDKNGRYVDRYLVRKGDNQTFISSDDLFDIMDDLSVLAENRFNKILRKSRPQKGTASP